MRTRVVLIVAFLVCLAVSAAAQTPTLSTGLGDMKVKSVALQGDDADEISNYFMATAIMGELLRRGAVVSNDGLEVAGRLEWSKVGGRYVGVKVAASVFDSQGVSFSVTASHMDSFASSSEQLARFAAREFGKSLDEQITAQQDRGRNGTVKPAPPVPPSVVPGQAISRVGLGAIRTNDE